MTTFTQLIRNLQRSLFIVLSCTLLNACGGDLKLSDGIGGTGIARITAFGSVYVNGIHYNTDDAKFYFNDKISQQSDLKLGYIVRVEGKINPDKKTGVAERVTYSETLTGPVTQLADGKTIVIMNQYVVTDELTLLHGFKELADLDTNNIIGVSGFRSADGTITASSIRWISERYESDIELRVEGFINIRDDGSESSQPNSIEGLNISNYLETLGTAAKSQRRTPATKDALVNIDAATLGPDTRPYVTIISTENLQDNTLITSRISGLDDKSFPAKELFEIEGSVTSLASSGEFSVGGQPMSTSDPALINKLTENAYVVISGRSDEEGKLVAEAVTINTSNDDIALKATLQSIDLENSTITILGQTAHLSTSTLISDSRGISNSALLLKDFSENESILVVTRKDSNGQLTVARLSKIEGLTDTISIAGSPEAIDSENARLTLFNQTIFTDSSTEYVGPNQSSFLQDEFFSIIAELQAEVLVTGRIGAEGTIDATRLEFSE